MLGDELLTMDHQKLPRANTYVHVVRYDAIQVGYAPIQVLQGMGGWYQGRKGGRLCMGIGVAAP